MDVRKWLEETAGDASSEQVQQIGADKPKIVDQHNHSAIRRSYLRHRRHNSSDALLAPLQHDQHGRRATPRKSSREDEHRRHSKRSGRESDSPSSNRTRAEEFSKAYRKRKRHKTREDRYERKSKKPHKERESRRSPKPRKKERKSGHGGDGDHTMGLVQSFQLKNGRKNSRLTLRPESNAGFLKHGRASTQFDSRGRGLPDLAFNEMKFLQRPIEQLEPVEATKPHSAKDNDPTHGRNNDISAYFNLQKDTTIKQTDQAGLLQEKPRDLPNGKETTEHRKTHPRASPKEPTEVPFLGFGSRGPRPPSPHRARQNSSYVSWSESSPQRGTPAKLPPKARSKRLSLEEPIRTAPRPIDKDNGAQDTSIVISKRANGTAGEWLPSKRVRGPTVVEVYRPVNEERHAEYSHRPSTRTTVQSLPQQNIAKHEQQNAEASFTERIDRLSNTYRTSDILHIEQKLHSVADRATQIDAPQLEGGSAVNDKENRDPSSGIERLLHQARRATEKVRSPAYNPHGAATIPENTRLSAPYEPEDAVFRIRRDSHRLPRNPFPPEVRRRPQSHRTLMNTLDPMVVRHGDFAPEVRQRNTESHHWVLNEHIPSPEASVTWQTHGWNPYLDDEMLDNDLTDLTPSIATAPEWATGPGTGVQAFCESRGSSSSARRKRLGLIEIEPSERSSLAQQTMALIPQATAENARFEQSPLVQNDADSELIGFWKPNRLY